VISRKSAIALAAFITVLSIILSNTLSSRASDPTIFYDAFEGELISKQWIVSHVDAEHKKNPSPCGCPWSNTEVWQTNTGILNVNLNGSTNKCGEIKSQDLFSSGRFIAHMKPVNISGTTSTFFLYTGATGGAKDHYEIDIEFIGGTNLLHTNYWIAGKKDTNGVTHEVDIDLTKEFKIDPYSKFRRYGFEWRSNKIIWFTEDDAGQRKDLRTEDVSLKANMPIFMNNWRGDNILNKDKRVPFPGYYNEDTKSGGTAQYDYVLVEKLKAN
jgi:endo-1,3-1,4-beta-glycanase ExoK